MNVSKLFGVLVVGGSLLVAGGCGANPDPDDDSKQVLAPDAAQDSPQDASTSTADANGDLEACFCDFQPCCVRDENDEGTVQEGFECCWTTTC